MHAIDFSPLFRNSIGFDRVQQMLDAATRVDTGTKSYPPYNIETLSENAYRITMAVAGFGADDLDVTVKENTLVITGKGSDQADQGTFLYHGIAQRAFERRFQLDDTVRVAGAGLDNGLLHVELVREIPEDRKPRRIEIQTDNPTGSTKTIESDKAA